MTFQRERVTLDVTRYTRLEMLKQFFLAILVEDPIDGTVFDLDVLNAIESLKEKYKNK